MSLKAVSNIKNKDFRVVCNDLNRKAFKLLKENIKQNKLGLLYNESIPDKYTAELARKKIVL